MQKLVTFFLSDDDDDDIEVQEHLDDYLEDGWSVKSVTPMGAGCGQSGGEDADGHCYVAGWLAVVLEK
jgi:hypothetical protein